VCVCVCVSACAQVMTEVLNNGSGQSWVSSHYNPVPGKCDMECGRRLAHCSNKPGLKEARFCVRAVHMQACLLCLCVCDCVCVCVRVGITPGIPAGAGYLGGFSTDTVLDQVMNAALTEVPLKHRARWYAHMHAYTHGVQ
jgi:hypothetical protein